MEASYKFAIVSHHKGIGYASAHILADGIAFEVSIECLDPT
jgi:hypothetical protein